MEIEQKNKISYEIRVQVLFESGKTKPDTLINKVKTMRRDAKQLREEGYFKRKECYSSNKFMINAQEQKQIEKSQIKNSFLRTCIECDPIIMINELQRQVIPTKIYKKPMQKIKFYWKKVIFVDESSFVQIKNQTNFSRKKEILYIQVRKYPQKIQLFGGICKNGSTSLHIFEGPKTGEIYKGILQNICFLQPIHLTQTPFSIYGVQFKNILINKMLLKTDVRKFWKILSKQKCEKTISFNVKKDQKMFFNVKEIKQDIYKNIYQEFYIVVFVSQISNYNILLQGLQIRISSKYLFFYVIVFLFKSRNISLCPHFSNSIQFINK